MNRRTEYFFERTFTISKENTQNRKRKYYRGKRTYWRAHPREKRKLLYWSRTLGINLQYYININIDISAT